MTTTNNTVREIDYTAMVAAANRSIREMGASAGIEALTARTLHIFNTNPQGDGPSYLDGSPAELASLAVTGRVAT